jgi:hypothetical protein
MAKLQFLARRLTAPGGAISILNGGARDADESEQKRETLPVGKKIRA